MYGETFRRPPTVSRKRGWLVPRQLLASTQAPFISPRAPALPRLSNKVDSRIDPIDGTWIWKIRLPDSVFFPFSRGRAASAHSRLEKAAPAIRPQDCSFLSEGCVLWIAWTFHRAHFLPTFWGTAPSAFCSPPSLLRARGTDAPGFQRSRLIRREEIENKRAPALCVGKQMRSGKMAIRRFGLR